jgi:methionyl-tRNA formyltransferase
MTVTASPVKRFALAHRLPIAQPARLRDSDALATLRRTELDVLVVAAYGAILPQAVLDWPRHGCINIHASLLPRWRGAAPVARAVEAGDTVTGITIMQMDAGLDTGAMLAREEVPIAPRDTAGSLHDRLAELGARVIVDVLRALERDGALHGTAQPEDGVTYAAKIERSDRIVRWTATAIEIDRKVRALSPAPGAVATWHGTPFRIIDAEPALAEGAHIDEKPPSASECGAVLAVDQAGIDVRCGANTRLRLRSLQPAGGRAMPANAFAVGRAVVVGARFGPGVA